MRLQESRISKFSGEGPPYKARPSKIIPACYAELPTWDKIIETLYAIRLGWAGGGTLYAIRLGWAGGVGILDQALGGHKL